MAWNQLSSNHSPGAHVATQWYQKTWVILAFLFFFFPVGVFLMWKFTDWKKRTKQIFSGIFGVWFVYWALVWIAVIFGPDLSIKQIQIDSTETTIVLDINEEKTLPIKLEPENASSTGLKYYSDDTNIVSFDDGTIKGLSEGSTTVYLTYRDINSNTVRVVVEDKERIEAEKQEKAEQEEQKQKNEKQANDIVKQIKALEEPTLDNKSKIEEIRKSYDKLPSEVKTLVTNLSDLETAEKKISELEQAQREQERLEAEAAEQAEQERLAAEQAAQQKAEQERLAAEQAAQQKAEQEKAQQQQQQETPPQQTQQEKPQQPTQQEKPVETPKPPEQQTQQPPANPNSGRTIYRTKNGKRYHYDGNCNGGTYYPTTLEEALNARLTPCQKCVY